MFGVELRDNCAQRECASGHPLSLAASPLCLFESGKLDCSRLTQAIVKQVLAQIELLCVAS
jgi:hypothetical protein